MIDLVLDGLEDPEHARKWGRLTFTRGGDWHHWICAVTATRKAAKLAIHKGSLLADPEGVMEGDGTYTRTISFRERAEVEGRAAAVGSILREAAAKQTEMLPDEG